jgi:hypothetical protein
MPCAGSNFSAVSLGCLQGKRARIFTDSDTVGNAAAKRWATQLRSAGVAVDGYTFDGLTRDDGQPVKDLNDLLRIDCVSGDANREALESVMNFAFQEQGGVDGRGI